MPISVKEKRGAKWKIAPRNIKEVSTEPGKVISGRAFLGAKRKIAPRNFAELITEAMMSGDKSKIAPGNLKEVVKEAIGRGAIFHLAPENMGKLLTKPGKNIKKAPKVIKNLPAMATKPDLEDTTRAGLTKKTTKMTTIRRAAIPQSGYAKQKGLIVVIFLLVRRRVFQSFRCETFQAACLGQ